MFVNKYTLFIYAIVIHVGLATLVFTANWYDWMFLILMYSFFRCFGTSMMYHRYYSHLSWNPPTWFKIFGTICGVLSCEGTPISWTCWHLTHHKNSDTPEDPHSPLYRNKFYIWFMPMFSKVNVRYGIRLIKDPVAIFFHKWYWAIHLTYGTIIYLVYPYGLISLYLAPAALTWISGSMLNIFNHLYGTQDNKTNDNSRNSRFHAYISFGEGWHNNHHYTSSSHRHGPFDPAARIIEWLDPSKKH